MLRSGFVSIIRFVFFVGLFSPLITLGDSNEDILGVWKLIVEGGEQFPTDERLHFGDKGFLYIETKVRKRCAFFKIQDDKIRVIHSSGGMETYLSMPFSISGDKMELTVSSGKINIYVKESMSPFVCESTNYVLKNEGSISLEIPEGWLYRGAIDENKAESKVQVFNPGKNKQILIVARNYGHVVGRDELLGLAKENAARISSELVGSGKYIVAENRFKWLNEAVHLLSQDALNPYSIHATTMGDQVVLFLIVSYGDEINEVGKVVESVRIDGRLLVEGVAGQD